MKEYFTSKDRTKHILIVGMNTIIKEFADSEALTPTEAKNLRIAATYLDKASDSIFERFGEPYRKKLLSMNRDNKIDFVSRYGTRGVTISNVANEDIEPALADLRAYRCTGCDKTDFKDCAVYNLCLACDCQIKGYNNGNSCPYGCVSSGDDLW